MCFVCFVFPSDCAVFRIGLTQESMSRMSMCMVWCALVVLIPPGQRLRANIYGQPAGSMYTNVYKWTIHMFIYIHRIYMYHSPMDITWYYPMANQPEVGIKMAALGAATVFAASLLPRTGAFVALPPVSRTGHQLPEMSLGCLAVYPSGWRVSAGLPIFLPLVHEIQHSKDMWRSFSHPKT